MFHQCMSICTAKETMKARISADEPDWFDFDLILMGFYCFSARINLCSNRGALGRPFTSLY